MNAPEVGKLFVDRRLQADGKAVDPRALIQRDLLFAHRPGVHLDGDLGTGGERKALLDLAHGGVDILGIDDGGRSAAEIDGIEGAPFQLLAAHLDLLDEARHVRFRNVHTVGKRTEIAVCALVFAERNMQIDARHITPPSGICSDRRIRRRLPRPPPPRGLPAPLRRRTRTRARAAPRG